MSDPTDADTPAPQRITVRRDNAVRDVTPDQLADAEQEGFHEESSDERASRVITAAQDEAAGTLAPVGAALARGATLGGTDMFARLIGDQDTVLRLRHMAENNPRLSMIAEMAGGLALGGGVGKLGAAVEGLTGSSLAGMAAEGAIYGAGGGVSKLALSDDPLTAEHAFDVIGHDAILGAGIGAGIGGVTKLAGKALSRASEAMQAAGKARAALDGLPEELHGLDQEGLEAAAETRGGEIKDAIKAEETRLEGIRDEQKAAAASEVKGLHDVLAEESPIFHAVNGEDVAEIEGVKDIKVQLAKSFKRMRAQFDNPIGMARNPERLIEPLQMRQAALEALQPKIPELQAALAGDTRAIGLDYVGDALEQTKSQIEHIESIAGKRAQPVMSDALANLKAGGDAKLAQIKGAIEAMKKAPELGMVGKALKGGTFGAVTAVAHAIPGMGIAAPYVGAWASEAVGRLISRVGRGVAESAERSGSTVGKLLSATERVRTPAIASATEVLRSVRFAPGVEPRSSDLASLYHARAAELRSQTQLAPDGSTVMRPAARLAVAQRLAPIAVVMPTLADKLESSAARTIAYLSASLPKHPDVGGLQIGPDTWRPSDLEMRAMARRIRGALDPHSVEERLAAGIVTPEECEAYRVCHPARFQAMQLAIAQAAPQLSKTLPMARKIALYVFTGVPTMAALQPNVLKQLQANFATEQGTNGGQSAPKPAPNFGALGSLPDLDKPTRAQQRAE